VNNEYGKHKKYGKRWPKTQVRSQVKFILKKVYFVREIKKYAEQKTASQGFSGNYHVLM
jgi:hypothetical protein